MRYAIFVLNFMFLGLIACEDNGNSDAEQAGNRLENFVDSVETELSAEAKHDWAAIDRKYKRLKSDAEDAYATGEERSDLEKLEGRYDSVKAEVEKESKHFSAESEKHLNRMQNWIRNTADEVSESSDEMAENAEARFRESMEWLEKNYENLEEGTRRQYDKAKEAMQSDKSSDRR